MQCAIISAITLSSPCFAPSLSEMAAPAVEWSTRWFEPFNRSRKSIEIFPMSWSFPQEYPALDRLMSAAEALKRCPTSSKWSEVNSRNSLPPLKAVREKYVVMRHFRDGDAAINQYPVLRVKDFLENNTFS
jgi:hypothetical protein